MNYKYLLFIAAIVLFLTLTKMYMNEEKQVLVTLDNFNTIREFVLQNGDTLTYRNIDNDNPHYRFSEDVDVYLNTLPRNSYSTGRDLPPAAYFQITIQYRPEKGTTQYYDISIDETGSDVSLEVDSRDPDATTQQGYRLFRDVLKETKRLRQNSA